MRAFSTLLLVTFFYSCKREPDLLGQIPAYPEVSIVDSGRRQGAPFKEYSVRSDVALRVIKKYDSVLSLKWNRSSFDTSKLRECSVSAEKGRICGGSINWMATKDGYQMSMMISGFPQSEWRLEFYQFVSGPR